MKQNNPDKTALLALVSRHFPEVPITHVEQITTGWNTNVLLINGTTIFRIPKTPFAKKQLQRELLLLPEIEQQLPFAIPSYHYRTSDASIAGYPIINGIECKRWFYYNKFSKQQRQRLAGDLSAFLRSLHRSSVSHSIKKKTDNEFARERAARTIGKIEPLLRKKLNQKEFNTATAYFEEFVQTLSQQPAEALLHGDFKIHHIFLHPKKLTLTGIIDFGYIQWGDPAVDLSNLFAFPDIFVKAVIDAYSTNPGTRQSLLERTRLYKKSFGIYWMIGALEGAPLPFERGYRLFRQMFFKR